MTNILNFGPELDSVYADVQQILTIVKNIKVETDEVVAALATLATLNNQRQILADLALILADQTGPPVPTSVKFDLITYTPLHGGNTMAGTVTMTDDHVAHIPVKWADDVGPVAAPSDAAVVSSDITTATVAFASSMTDVDVTPLKDGTVTVTVSSASLHLSDMATVTIGAPAATSVNVDAADATFTPKI